MAGDVRPPGDVSVHTVVHPRRYRYRNGTNTPGNDAKVPYGAFNVVNQATFRSERPFYTKGVVVQLPGGSSFRRSTAYKHSSSSVAPLDNALYECEYWRRRDQLAWIYAGGQDEGREIGYLVNHFPPRAGTSIPQDARNEAVTKALNKIADQKVNLGENLATLGQTLRLFTSKASLLLDALRYARRVKSWRKLLEKSERDLRRAGPLSVVAQQYLAYIYGLKPLMQDVYTVSQLAKEQGMTTLLLKGVGKATRMSVVKPAKLGPFSYCEMDLLGGSYSHRVKCTIWARLDPNGTSLRSLNQLGLLNPLGLAWDLVPYSFVVDWFLPVGPVLYALTAPAGLIFVDGSIACRTSETNLVNYRIGTSSVDYYRGSLDPKYERPMTWTYNYEGYQRDRLGTWPLPGLWVDQDPFRFDRPVKALALAIVALGGKRSPVR